MTTSQLIYGHVKFVQGVTSQYDICTSKPYTRDPTFAVDLVSRRLPTVKHVGELRRRYRITTVLRLNIDVDALDDMALPTA